jgi:hypothetical protein
VHFIEKIEEAVRNGNGPGDLGPARQEAGKDNSPARAVDLVRREIHGLGEIAAGVMQQAAKGPRLGVLQPVRSINKGLALFVIEKEPLSLLIEKVRCRHAIV